MNNNIWDTNNSNLFGVCIVPLLSLSEFVNTQLVSKLWRKSGYDKSIIKVNLSKKTIEP